MVSLERFFKAIFGVQEFVFEIVQLPPSLKKLMDRPLRRDLRQRAIHHQGGRELSILTS